MPAEGHGVSAVEAALLQRHHLVERALDPIKHIQGIDLRTTAAADLIINKAGPLHNAAGRDHCIQFAVALAFLKGGAPEAADYFDNSPWANSEDLASLRNTIKISPDPELTRDYLDLEKKSIGTGLTVTIRDGTPLPEILVEYPVGHVRNPGTKTDVNAKFWRSMRRMFSEAEIIQISDRVQDENLPVKDFVDRLARPERHSKL